MLILLPPELARRYERHLADAGADEIGGILMGEQLLPGRFRIVDFTVDVVDAEKDRFVRDMDRHAEALREFFVRTGGDYERFNYLGEWHSHPRFAVAPSATDFTSMQELVDGGEGIHFALLLILKLVRRGRMQASATLFTRRGRRTSVEFRQEIESDVRT